MYGTFPRVNSILTLIDARGFLILFPLHFLMLLSVDFAWLPKRSIFLYLQRFFHPPHFPNRTIWDY